MGHVQKQVVCAGEVIEVDAGMVFVLKALWDAGVSTRFSCQGNPDFPGSGYITFESKQGLMKGLSVLGVSDDVTVFYSELPVVYSDDSYPSEEDIASAVTAGGFVEILPNQVNNFGDLGVRFVVRLSASKLVELNESFAAAGVKPDRVVTLSSPGLSRRLSSRFSRS